METLSIEEAGRRLGLRRKAAYEAAIRGTLSSMIQVEGIFPLPRVRVIAALLGKSIERGELVQVRPVEPVTTSLTALCKWPIGDNCFCDSPAARREAYCSFHEGIAALYKKSAQTE